jgi:hypothetical protein
MKIANNARIIGVRTEMLFATMAVESVFSTYGLEAVITSAIDGEHSPGSLHYTGSALDYRTRFFATRADAEEAAGEVREALGPDFDVVLEDTHLHIEFDPKGAINGG